MEEKVREASSTDGFFDASQAHMVHCAVVWVGLITDAMTTFYVCVAILS